MSDYTQNDLETEVIPEIEVEEALETEDSAESEEEVFVTKAELKKLKAEMLQEATRTAQSYADKTASRLDRRLKTQLAELQNSFAVLKASGVEVTDAQIDAAKQKVIARALAETDVADETPVQPVVSPDAQVIAARQRIEAKYGSALSADDPESDEVLKYTQGANPQPAEFLRLYEKALKAKVDRESTPPEAKLPGAGLRQGKTPASVPQAALLAEFEKLSKEPSKNARRMAEIAKLLK